MEITALRIQFRYVSEDAFSSSLFAYVLFDVNFSIRASVIVYKYRSHSFAFAGK